MRIQVLTVCYNESQRIFDFLLHYYILGVHKITIYDNKSTDNTVELCNRFNELIANIVEVVEYDTNGEIRDNVYLDIKNNKWKSFDSDWIIVVDCDEFLELHPDDYDSTKIYNRLHSLLERYEALGILLPVVKGIQVVTNKFADLQDDSIAKYAPDQSFNKRCIFTKKLFPVYRPGCHDFRLNEPTATDINRIDIKPLYLFHYKHIDIDYVVARYKEFSTRLSEYNKQNQYGVQYQMSEDAIKLKFKYYKRFALTEKELFTKEL